MITSSPIHLLCSGYVFPSIVWVHIEKVIFAELDNFAAFYSAQEVHYCGRNNLPHATHFILIRNNVLGSEPAGFWYGSTV
jgi:hypothetical protein